ncbi:MAG: hypothetical protein H6R11_2307, partial [Proteobacteria bacterium]|nr:hypothetical protein [Pseudomonadota bacterium]
RPALHGAPSSSWGAPRRPSTRRIDHGGHAPPVGGARRCDKIAALHRLHPSGWPTIRFTTPENPHDVEVRCPRRRAAAGRFGSRCRPGEDRVRFHALRSRRRSRRGHPRRLQSGGEAPGRKVGRPAGASDRGRRSAEPRRRQADRRQVPEERQGRFHDRHRFFQHHARRRPAGIRVQDLLRLRQCRAVPVCGRAVQSVFLQRRLAERQSARGDRQACQ